MPKSRDVEEEPGILSAPLRVAASATLPSPASRSQRTSRSATTTSTLSTIMLTSRDVEEEPGIIPTSRSQRTSRFAPTSSSKPADPPPVVARPKKQRSAKQIAATARLGNKKAVSATATGRDVKEEPGIIPTSCSQQTSPSPSAPTSSFAARVDSQAWSEERYPQACVFS